MTNNLFVSKISNKSKVIFIYNCKKNKAAVKPNFMNDYDTITPSKTLRSNCSLLKLFCFLLFLQSIFPPSEYKPRSFKNIEHRWQFSTYFFFTRTAFEGEFLVLNLIFEKHVCLYS